jgi:MoaA/NifB/PqqE/SkfB family radical SAM enzyme
MDGKIKACCHSEGVVSDDQGEPFDILKGHTFKDAYHSEYMQSLRSNLLKGVKDERCNLCWKLEALGLQSKRLHDGNRYLEKTLERIKTNSLGFQPLSWDIKLGSHCNLKCRMCEPTTSTALMMEAISQGWEDKDAGLAYSKATGDLLKYPNFFNELKSVIPYAEEVYFLGGEPTLIESHLSLLDFAIENGAAKNMTVRWSTNLSFFDDRFISRAAHFKKVVIDCSIDGYAEVNEYIRPPSKWEKTNATIDQIKEKLPNAFIKDVCTVQIYNIFEIEKLVEWCTQKKVSLGLNFLDFPNHLSVQILPQKIKEALIKKYSGLSGHHYKNLIQWLQGPENLPLWRVFLAETKKFDTIRGKDFEQLVPPAFRQLFLEEYKG